MPDSLIVQLAIEEVETKTWGVTEQLLQIHEVVCINNRPEAIRVISEGDGKRSVVYFAIKGEKFYLVIYLDTKPEVKIIGVGTEPYHAVYFCASSDDLSFDELSALTKLQPTGGWNKGQKRSFGQSLNKYSMICIEPNKGPDEFERKLRNLLNVLEQDENGILQLVDCADGYIQAASIFHNGNTMLGGNHIEKDLIRRMAALGLGIDFDLYAEGKKFLKD